MSYRYYQPYWLNDNELEHYGVKGQKWGIRNYQNEDGSLTTAGKQRYSESRGGGFRLGARGSGFGLGKSGFSKGLSNSAVNGYGKNSIDFLQRNKDLKSGSGKYQTKSTNSDRIIKMPSGYSTTKSQRESFYNKISKSGSYTTDTMTIPGAVIYTYRTLVDSPEGQMLLEEQESPYNDCIIKSIEVDWNTGELIQHSVVAKDHDIKNITYARGNSALNNWMNSVANAQIKAKATAQVMEKKAKELVDSVLKKVGSAIFKK